MDAAAHAPLPSIDRGRSLASMTTLEVGGPALEVVTARDEASLRTALADARRRELPTFVLGGGSNVLASDDGFAGRVLRYDARGLTIERGHDVHGGDGALVRAEAGLDWDAFVEATVEAGLGGVECLSGIPGRVGAAPIQNIGAYGQEVAETIVQVRALDRTDGAVRTIDVADCGFGYRTSRFKTEWRDRFLVTRVDFRLPARRHGVARYGELRRVLGLDLDPDDAASATRPERAPSLEAVRQAVLAVRRAKSMVLDPDDRNRRSAGSFFVNPVVPATVADEVARRAAARGVERALPRHPANPRPPAADGSEHVKLSAAWLIEEAGFPRGYAQGPVGLSTRHTLALVNRGGARAADLVALARTVRQGVREAFGVVLEPEPVFLGFDRPVHELLESAP